MATSLLEAESAVGSVVDLLTRRLVHETLLRVCKSASLTPASYCAESTCLTALPIVTRSLTHNVHVAKVGWRSIGTRSWSLESGVKFGSLHIGRFEGPGDCGVEISAGLIAILNLSNLLVCARAGNAKVRA